MGYSAVRQAAPARTRTGEATTDVLRYLSRRMAMDGGPDNEIATDGDEGERALVNIPAGGDFNDFDFITYGQIADGESFQNCSKVKIHNVMFIKLENVLEVGRLKEGTSFKDIVARLNDSRKKLIC